MMAVGFVADASAASTLYSSPTRFETFVEDPRKNTYIARYESTGSSRSNSRRDLSAGRRSVAPSRLPYCIGASHGRASRPGAAALASIAPRPCRAR
jgi:hypothetical protein